MERSETDLIASVQAGNLQDFDGLYTRHVDAIYKYLHRRTLVKQVAEDLTSITFLKALQSVRSFNPSKGELRAWLYRIARNALIDHYRRNSNKSVDIDSVWDLASDELTEVDTERSIDAKKLHEALSKLTPDQRHVVLLRIWEDLSYKEIAELTGKTEANCKVIFSRSMADLKKNLPALLVLFVFLTLSR